MVVRLVLEGDYLTVRRAVQKPFEPGGANKINRLIHDAILRSNINLKSDFNPSIFHQKFMVRDGSALLTGSTNFTDTGTSTNLNHLIIIRHEDIARIYRREFKEIMKQIAKARKRIDFAVFTFSESSGIDDQMIALSRAGIKIRGALDSTMANNEWAARHNLLEEDTGIKLWGIPSQGMLRKLHHKLMVIDEQVLIAGSFNYTDPANRLNYENIIILVDLGDSSDISVSSQKTLASYALGEIDRIIETYGQRLHH